MARFLSIEVAKPGGSVMIGLLVFVYSLLAIPAKSQPPSVRGWQFVNRKEAKQVDVLFEGRLVTSYCYYDSIRKPILFPLRTVSGIEVTRGYPVAPRPGDHVDHPHHTGLWLTYESVNGIDFWNNSPAIAVRDRRRYGTIRHDRILAQTALQQSAELRVSATWVAGDGTTPLQEETTYSFRQAGTQVYIDRATTLTALKDVLFKDAKDGFLGIRVASELEMPAREPLEFLDARGNVTKADSTAKKATGLYLGSTGLTGDAVWGTRGKWCMLRGTKEGENIAISILDHPANIGYPTYWHARGYGLFAANPLGQEVFSNGKEKLGFTLASGKSVTFRYRIIITSGTWPDPTMLDREADIFSRKK
jgi:hypothetical protein